MDQFTKLTPAELAKCIEAWVKANKDRLIHLPSAPTAQMQEVGYYATCDGWCSVRQSHSHTSTKIEIVYDS
jgi:hypothetical protein